MTQLTSGMAEIAPGSVVQVRDEEWLVTAVELTTGGQLLTVRGLSELTRDTTASFYDSPDDVTVVDPASMIGVADDIRTPYWKHGEWE